MFLIGYFITTVVMAAWFTYQQYKMPKILAAILGLVWFVSLPLMSCFIFWGRRKKIVETMHNAQIIMDQLTALRQLQEQMTAFNRGNSVDNNYE